MHKRARKKQIRPPLLCFEFQEFMAEIEQDLKGELEGLVNAIINKEHYHLETIEEALETLCELKLLKFNATPSLGRGHIVPEEFRCPITDELMADPVILASGQTYDRASIEKWLAEGNRTCPKSQEVLSHSFIIPNHLVYEIISYWCRENGIDRKSRDQNGDEQIILNSDKSHFCSLLEKMSSSSSLSDQKEAAKELQFLTKRLPSVRAFFSESCDNISQLLKPLLKGGETTNENLLEMLITIILNVSVHDENKKLLAENHAVVPLLIESLTSSNIVTRRNSAAALFSLSSLDSNKLIIGESGALKPLIKLLEEAHPLAVKDIASAIMNLCVMNENKGRAVEAGIVGMILKKLRDRTHVKVSLAMLASLGSYVVEELVKLGGIPCLLGLLRDETLEVNKEKCIVVLSTVSSYDTNTVKEIEEEEKANRTISALVDCGTPRAKRKANWMLDRFGRGKWHA